MGGGKPLCNVDMRACLVALPLIRHGQLVVHDLFLFAFLTSFIFCFFLALTVDLISTISLLEIILSGGLAHPQHLLHELEIFDDVPSSSWSQSSFTLNASNDLPTFTSCPSCSCGLALSELSRGVVLGVLEVMLLIVVFVWRFFDLRATTESNAFHSDPPCSCPRWTGPSSSHIPWGVHVWPARHGTESLTLVSSPPWSAVLPIDVLFVGLSVLALRSRVHRSKAFPFV